MSIRLKILPFCVLSFLFIGCDRVTKDLVKNNLTEGVSASYLHDTFRLVYVQNTGAALNLGDNLPPSLSFWLLSILPLLALLSIFYYTVKNAGKMRSMKLLSICLIFAGGIGNIIDRLLFDRHVTDFMNVGVGNFRTGIFNFADLCVTTGVILFLIFRNAQQKVAYQHQQIT